MRAIFKSVVLTILLMAVPAPGGPKEELNDLLTSARRQPNDVALREKIINLVHSMKTKPKAPAELNKEVGKAKIILKNAKSTADYTEAAAAYVGVVTLAPWVADHHYNLATIYEKAEKPAEALASYKLYLLANPKAKDKVAIEEKIGGLEYLAGKAAEKGKVEGFVYSFRTQVEGKTFKETICFIATVGEKPKGCTAEERGGTNWQTFGNQAKFVFPGDGTIRLCNTSFCDKNAYLLIGIPRGHALSEIDWFAPSYEGEGPTQREAGRVSVHMESSSHGQFTFSRERPPGRALSAEERHFYHSYTTN